MIVKTHVKIWERFDLNTCGGECRDDIMVGFIYIFIKIIISKIKRST